MTLSEEDAMRFNQKIAREGVLPYGSVMKAKLWKDLEANIGIDVPILYEHPDKGNGKDGMYSGKERRYGTAHLKACQIGKKILCADLDLDDDAPKTKGYSIGFKYDPLIGAGELGGRIFHMVQSKLKINHLALTDFNREPIADADAQSTTMVPGDTTFGLDSLVETSTAVLESTTRVHKYEIAYDSFRFTSSKEASKPKNNTDTDDKKMTDEDKLIGHLESENKTLKTDIEDKKGLIADKDSKIADLEKQVTDRDSKITKLEEDNGKLADGIKTFQDEKDKAGLDALLDKTKIKADDADLGGATPDNVKFAKMIVDKLNLESGGDSKYQEDNDSDLPPPSFLKEYNPLTQKYEVPE